MCVCMCMPPSGILKPASPGQCLVCSGKICDKLRERVNSLAKFHAEMPSHIPSKKWMRAWPDPASLCPEKQEEKKRNRRKMSSCTNSAKISACSSSLASLPPYPPFLFVKKNAARSKTYVEEPSRFSNGLLQMRAKNSH